ncbi:alpha/beta hydrolase [Arthrobacter echini]|uniref:Alpha/beta hydrolase n=1 Tax=Arthrobacter echini TaxID=1529066 RepID=A0A4S5E4U8_9MICC|nr:alpha/beta hydrolase [Arthrobacter echini]THJ66526.1 alpha/beta hydrolase [Arthrobacter echini]
MTNGSMPGPHSDPPSAQDGSLAMRVASWLIGFLPTKKHLASPEWVRETYIGRTYPSMAAIPWTVKQKHTIQETRIDGVRTITVRPILGATRSHIIYTHGGIYLNELGRPHWWIIAELTRRTGATVTVPLYRLAPESTYREAFGYLVSVYREVLRATGPEEVTLMGDSAGGGLAIAQPWAFSAAGLPAPGRIVVFSPWLDVTGTNPGIPAYDAVDPMLSVAGGVQAGLWWAGGEDPRTPLVSPARAPDEMLARVPTTRIYQGTRDICMADATVFRDRAAAAGADVTMRVYPGGFHVFPAFPRLPEAREVYSDIEAFLGRPALP